LHFIKIIVSYTTTTTTTTKPYPTNGVGYMDQITA